MRACAHCTLVCEDPRRVTCEACGNVLPKALVSGEDDLEMESFIIPSDSEDESQECLKQSPLGTSPPTKLQRAESGAISSCQRGSSSSSLTPASASGGRVSAIASDFQAARRRFSACAGADQIAKLELDDETVSFQLSGHEGDFNLFLAETYPAGKSQVFGPDDWELQCDGALERVLERVLEAYPARSSRAKRGAVDSQSSLGVAMEDEDCLSPRSDQSDRSACPIVADEPMEPLLARHVEQASRFLGSGAVDCTQRADSWRIRMRVPLVFSDGPPRPLLTEMSAKAWGVALDRPIVLELQIPIRGYTSALGAADGRMATAKVVTAAWQEGDEEAKDAAFQLEKQVLQILADFCGVALGHDVPRCCGEDDSIREELAAIEAFHKKKVVLQRQARGDPSEGFLVHLARYLRLRLQTVHEYCAICDQPFAVPPMFLRTVCTRQLCTYQFMEFGNRITTADAVNAQAEITDLLFCMFARAVNSPRHELIVDPYPNCSNSSRQMVFDPRKKDFNKLKKVVADLTAIRNEAASGIGAAWTSQRERMSAEGASLVKWIVSSNRSYLAPLQDGSCIQKFGTPFQYLLVSAPPDREAQFQQLKQQHGAQFVYHGSGTENWHAIFRNGLKNCSGTKYQTAGAAYGAGIYLSPDSHLSLGYSMRELACQAPGHRPATTPQENKRQTIGNRSLKHMEGLFMLAVCEVINHPSLTKHKEGKIWLMPNEEMVLTRFFIVFTETKVGIPNIPISSVASELQACLERQRVGCVGGNGRASA